MWFIWILILFFIFLLSYSFWTTRQREGFDGYTEYDTSNPNNALILSQQNAGNIAYLKQRVDELAGIQTTVNNLTTQVNEQASQIQGLVQQQASYAEQVGGTTPVAVTGT